MPDYRIDAEWLRSIVDRNAVFGAGPFAVARVFQKLKTGECEHAQKAKDRSRISCRQGQDEDNDSGLFAEQKSAPRNNEEFDETG
jgi:hypothetical protein